MASTSDQVLRILNRLGILTQQTLQEAREKFEKSKYRDIVEFLIKEGYLTEEDILKTLSTFLGIKIKKEISLGELDKEILNRVSTDILNRYKVIPVKLENGVLKVYTVNPFNSEGLNALKFLFKAQKVEPIVIPLSQFESLIQQLTQETENVMENLISELGEEEVETEAIEEEVNLEQLVKEAETSAPIVRLVNAIITEAVNRGASDIHIEPQEKEVIVRYRIDGILRIFHRFPNRIKDAIVVRIKIMANLDISERRKPQDGRIRLIIRGRKIDLRVSTLPVVYGEKVVMRIQEAEKYLQFTLDDLGFEKDNLFKFRHHIWQPWGMVLVTGPTGSGKTTTLYTALQERNSPEVNIMTAEDPVEVSIPGINQVQINERAGLTFAAALKAFLRQDPDIILVGEIRDLETGEIAIKAALTGHLVFSTLHTNDAPSTVTRLVDMGIEPFLVGTAVNLVVAQRLLRRLCPKCKRRAKDVYPPEFYREVETKVKEAIKRVMNNLQEMLAKEKEPEKKKKIMEALQEYQRLYKEGIEIYTENPDGCEYCSHTGYKGRMAVHEVMEITENVKKLILKGANAEEIKEEAMKEGMRTLYEDGLVKIGKGLTSIEEVKRVLIAE